MAQKVAFTYKDFNDESSTVGFTHGDMTAASFDADHTLISNLSAALGALTLCTQSKKTIVSDELLTGIAQPVDPYAQRESKWLVRYKDTSTQKTYSLEIPGADLTLLVAGDDRMDPANAAYIAFETAFEAYHRSPAGNPVSLLEIVHVGRNI